MCVVAVIIISAGPGFNRGLLVAFLLIANMIVALLVLFPGNLAAQMPYAVELEDGRGLRIYGPLKTVYVPVDEIKEVRRSWLHLGWVVKLSRRHRLLKSFVIHGGFGRQGSELARAIQEEIGRRGSA